MIYFDVCRSNERLRLFDSLCVYGPRICTYMIFKMFLENFIYQIFNFLLYCIHIYLLALQINLAQLSHILNFIYKAKIDGEIEGRLSLLS